MPIAVDVEQRLGALARATVAVAARRGAGGVTIRHVAAELGGSTTLVTNYLPTRPALLVNALTWILRGWEDERAALLAATPDHARLTALAGWSTTSTPEDDLFRALLVEVIAGPDATADLGPFLHEARRHRDELEDAARAAPVADPGFVADALFLLVRGTHFAAIEEPGRWDEPRAQQVVARVVELLARPA